MFLEYTISIKINSLSLSLGRSYSTLVFLGSHFYYVRDDAAHSTITTHTSDTEKLLRCTNTSKYT